MRLFLLVPAALLSLISLACGESTADPSDPASNSQRSAPPQSPTSTPSPAAAPEGVAELAALAASEVGGMQREGDVFAGQLQDGQTFEQAINIQPGKCYAIVGVGLGVQDLRIQLVAQLVAALPPSVVAQSNSTGANAVLGGKGQCFKNPLPVASPAKVIFRASGQGRVVGQIYVK